MTDESDSTYNYVKVTILTGESDIILSESDSQSWQLKSIGYVSDCESQI